MNPSQSVCSDEMEFDFKNIVECEKENLYNMKKQLEALDMDTDGDESQIIGKEMPSVTKKTENCNWQVLNDQVRDQMVKINKYSIMEYEWELKHSELNNIINHMTAEIKCQKCNENALISKIEDYEKKLKCTQKELCHTQVKLEEQKCEIQKLYNTRRTNEQEICKLREQLCHCTKEIDRLTKDLKCTKTEINAQKVCIATMEENIKNDRETYACELKNKCKKLEEEICKNKNLTSALKELNKTNEKNACDLYNCLLESKTERCAKESIICELENKVKELEQHTALKDIETRYNQNNCQSQQMKVFSEKLCKFKQKCASSQCQEKKAQKPACCNVKTDCCSPPKCCCSTPTNCCENSKKTCCTKTCCTKTCCINTNTTQNCEPKCPPKCEKSCNSSNKTDSNDLVCKLNSLKKDIEVLRMK